LMRLVLERLPTATLVSVAHRVELEAFHTRKLVLEYAEEGARLVGDEVLQPAVSVVASRSRDILRPVPRPRPVRDSASPVLAPQRAPAVVEKFPDYAATAALAPSA